MIRALEDRSPEVRSEVALRLGSMSGPGVLEARLRALGDPERAVRFEATRSFEPLIKALETEDWQIRQEAAAALGKIGDPRAIEPLTRALKDEHEWVRQAAQVALGEMQGK